MQVESSAPPAGSATAEDRPLVIGAGPAGLAVAACLLRHGVRPLVLERADAVGSSWRGHYDRLHLHTVKTHSSLPGLPFPADAPRYVSRDGVVEYLDHYARHHGIEVEATREVVGIETSSAGGGSAAGWFVRLADGRRHVSRHVVVATGANRKPREPALPGLARFSGRVLHSRDYRNAAPFTGQRVLVVGMGNTGAEIALDLADHGVRAALSVRSPVNIVRRDVLGRPTQLSSIALAKLPPAVGDRLATLVRDLSVGSLARWGIETAAASPLRQLREEGRTPVIDVGTVARIKAGGIVVHPRIDRLTPEGVCFTDGTRFPFDTVLLATGYSPAGPVPRHAPRPGRAGDAQGDDRPGRAHGVVFRRFRHPATGRPAADDRHAGAGACADSGEGDRIRALSRSLTFVVACRYS
jgi:hypothetical protein